MFTKRRWNFRYVRWHMTSSVLHTELSWHVKDKAYDNAYYPIARLARWRSQRAIEKEIEDVC